MVDRLEPLHLGLAGSAGETLTEMMRILISDISFLIRKNILMEDIGPVMGQIHLDTVTLGVEMTH